MDMDMEYAWQLSQPSESLHLSLQNIRDDQRVFKATMSLSRRPLTRWQLNRMLVRYPVMTGKITAAIYWQALKLWRKKCPYYSHPKNLQIAPSQTTT